MGESVARRRSRVGSSRPKWEIPGKGTGNVWSEDSDKTFPAKLPSSSAAATAGDGGK